MSRLIGDRKCCLFFSVKLRSDLECIGRYQIFCDTAEGLGYRYIVGIDRILVGDYYFAAICRKLDLAAFRTVSNRCQRVALYLSGICLLCYRVLSGRRVLDSVASVREVLILYACRSGVIARSCDSERQASRYGHLLAVISKLLGDRQCCGFTGVRVRKICRDGAILADGNVFAGNSILSQLIACIARSTLSNRVVSYRKILNGICVSVGLTFDWRKHSNRIVLLVLIWSSNFKCQARRLFSGRKTFDLLCDCKTAKRNLIRNGSVGANLSSSTCIPTRHVVFGNSIRYFLACTVVLGQVFPSVGPGIAITALSDYRCWNSHSFRNTIKGQGKRFRTLIQSVAVVVPNLIDANINKRVIVSIGYQINCVCRLDRTSGCTITFESSILSIPFFY